MGLSFAFLFFAIATIVIIIAGTKLARSADQLADITGLGEALMGAIFLGAATSLPGIITSVVTAYNGHAGLSISNAIGGIAVQTFFLSVADTTYRKINLEHAAVSLPNLMSGILLICLLSFIIIGMSLPSITILNIHPLSFILIIGYLAGYRMISNARSSPMWIPRLTKDTVRDIPDKNNKKLSFNKVMPQFVILAIFVAGAGYAIAISGINIAEKTGLSESFVGTAFTAISTSMPELIVSIAAVRRGALTLAVGNILGGNSFDVLFVSFSDFAYTNGSIFNAVSNAQILIIGLTMSMVSILILGLLYREQYGIGKIGWESALNILLYFSGILCLYFWI